eukprot:GEMP01015889.1.p1 GENE.GEMP01015889.1~~GEMP01015889.1.p1  ORF type:complete len:689 (+),score=166.00 GEMP01015889.1:57-2123(+)
MGKEYESEKKAKKHKKENKENAQLENGETHELPVKKKKKRVLEEAAIVEEVEEAVEIPKKKKRSREEVKEDEDEPASPRKEKKLKKEKKEKKKAEAAAAEDAERAPLPAGAVHLDDFPQLSETTKNCLRGRGFESLFEIQAKAFPPIFEGKDTVGKAKTGCGKTLAFVLPVVEKIIAGKMSTLKPRRAPLCVVVAPTRELAKQIFNEFEITCKAHSLVAACFYGGTPFGPQCHQIRDGLDFMVCTPGRILDHIRRETVDLSKVRFAILDEADEMLSMGFQEDVEEIMKALTHDGLQRLFFSATLPTWLNHLVETHMTKPIWIDVTSGENNQTNQNISHQCIACAPFSRGDTLGDLVKAHAGALFGKTIVFCDSKKEVGELCQHAKLIQLGAGMLHGDIPQESREVTLENFRSGKIKCLVATDVASRGLDIPSVDLVVNTRVPTDIDTYVHRSGRTARAGKKGTCITFYSLREEYMIRILRSKLGIPINRVGPPMPTDIVRTASKDAQKMIDNIPAENVEAFMEAARQLIEDRGAESCLAAALAAMTGYSSRVQARSLISSMEGMTTMILNSPSEIWTGGKAWGMLRDRCWDVSSSATGMQICAGKKTACFDVPSNMVKQVLSAEEWDGVTFSEASALPDIEERASDSNADWDMLKSHKAAFRDRIMGKRDAEKRGKGGKGKGKGKGGK